MASLTPPQHQQPDSAYETGRPHAGQHKTTLFHGCGHTQHCFYLFFFRGPLQDSPQNSPLHSRLLPLRTHRDHRLVDVEAQSIWDHVSQSPIRNLWTFEGVQVKVVLKRTGEAVLTDNLLSRAAELGYYFLFALFPMLISASSILGLAARHADAIYAKLLNYLSLIVPHSAYQMVIETFNQTTAASSGGKVTLGLVAALWTASVGFSAIQDGMNTVYRVRETRPYWKARGSAMLVTLLLGVIITATLGVLLAGDYSARMLRAHIAHPLLWGGLSFLLHLISWVAAIALLMLLFSTIYYFAPDLRHKCWHWLTPGASIGILTWILTSLALRVYLHFFNSYSLTYGSLGAVIILLTWFYVTGLTLLLGAEVNSEIQAAVAERALLQGTTPPAGTALKPAAVPPPPPPSPAKS
ncbi:MAG: YihY/virulence factor BrkB family protein [Acidobacteriaceae bacterium]|nr:YihY/virulence factor BrkB family protein [Acidobacteriaceae bacterium]